MRILLRKFSVVVEDYNVQHNMSCNLGTGKCDGNVASCPRKFEGPYVQGLYTKRRM